MRAVSRDARSSRETCILVASCSLSLQNHGDFPCAEQLATREGGARAKDGGTLQGAKPLGLGHEGGHRNTVSPGLVLAGVLLDFNWHPFYVAVIDP